MMKMAMAFLAATAALGVSQPGFAQTSPAAEALSPAQANQTGQNGQAAAKSVRKIKGTGVNTPTLLVGAAVAAGGLYAVASSGSSR